MSDKYNIGVIGAGSWGTALAILLIKNGHQVTMWEFRADAAERLKRQRENAEFLPGITLPPALRITNDLGEASRNKHILVIAVPSHVVREVAGKIAMVRDREDMVFVNVAKGIENESLMRMSEVLKDCIPWLIDDRIVTLSGPSHAEEVSRFIPTAIVAASTNLSTAKFIQESFMNSTFRVYTNIDILGVELGGALKNVVAIAAGICDGAGFGDNTKAALQPRGLVEMARLGTAMGAKPDTFAGLSGMGDLIVTCMSKHSRNRYVGEQIGKGNKLTEILSQMTMVAEGVKTTRSARELSKKYNIEMPITDQVYQILFEDKNARDALYDLMMREPKEEKLG
ncbi:NAD(P)H-dependent glycerol-3-phosphate dehydrogenase [candidate division KSB1 bacterium]|nr:NAD(P)H-dependent glycerol-3-phosphate dehydrogenase [candidate division KSB1 bacterium]